MEPIVTVPLQTPHSGYHWLGGPDRFFEGWYFRVTLPRDRQSAAFMYSIDDPAGGAAWSGGAAQILGPEETYLCRTLPQVERFVAHRDRLALSHDNGRGDYYRVTPTHHEGQLQTPTGQRARWHYHVQPVYGWGLPGRSQRATAGWMSFLPIFEPGWQILMAHGLATGWLEWGDRRYEFHRAPAYAEKNWGGAFPTKWFWLQCNAFEGEADLALTAAGGKRQVLGRTENAGLIGLHWQQQFYEFAPWNSTLQWTVAPWGQWELYGQSDRHTIHLRGTADHPPAFVRVPTATGLAFLCRDTTHGHLTLELRSRPTNQLLLTATSTLAGLETGGEPWPTVWYHASQP